ncbi:toprim domain-containing protein [Aromatoleum toluolicum]|uniref:Toprim domain-containing protein n=1 Tax=Aromatoleum toluolicum TaxID=90060 RepID=A0ABX1NKR0_9RHOO|nr:toprim domain-containing protein [Aromatoleum toluolicum]NMF99913.1 toprim domain-containing protein [Aromatoleum toluolicum]
MIAANIIDGFREAIHQAGLVPPAVIDADGLLHRFHVEGDKRGSHNGWYLLHLNGRAAGAFGSWKAGIQSSWAADGQRMSDAERDAFAELVKTARAKADAERRAEHEARAIEARAEWHRAVPADPAHPYLVAKHVQPHDLRQIGGALIVPLIDVYGLLWNLQRIRTDGDKRFRPGRAGGLYSPIGDLSNPGRILICEGWATGATLHEESGHPVLCAMNAGNLLSLAKAARAAWPALDLVICADNDRNTAGNPGVTAATAAATATGAKVIVPEFPEGASGSDFNDLAAIRRKGAAQ